MPMLAQEVMRRTAEVIEFRNGASLEIATNDARLIRGRSAIAVLGSECVYWKTDENAASSDEEVVAAAEPSMAMCPDGVWYCLAPVLIERRGKCTASTKNFTATMTATTFVGLHPRGS